MTGPKAFALGALLALIALHSVSSADVGAKKAQQAASAATLKVAVSQPPPGTAKKSSAADSTAPAAGNTKVAAGNIQQYQEDGAGYNSPDAYGPGHDSYSYQEQQQPYSYETKSDEKDGDSYGPDKGYESQKHDAEQQPSRPDPAYGEPDRQSYDGPADHPDESKEEYSEPKDKDTKEEHPDPSHDDKPDAPCPKAMSADAVENVYLGHGTASWKQLAKEHAESRSARRGKHGSKNPDRAVVKQISSEGRPDAIAPQGTHPARVGIASIPRVQALARPQKQNLGRKPAAAFLDVHTADKGEPGLSDPKFMLPVDLEISGRGVEGTHSGDLIPTDEALAVGPYPDNPAFVTVLHSVNAVAEIFTASKKTGERIPSRAPTKVDLKDLALKARAKGDVDQLTMGDPTAFYDCKDERWVLIWTSFSSDTSVTPSLFVAVSHGIDALGDWTIFSLEARPLITVGYRFCEKGGSYFSALAPQTSFSNDGIFVSVGASCGGEKTETAIMSTLFAYPKDSLYGVRGSNPRILAATYMGPMSWKSSISHQEQALVREEYRTFNNFITPARPQDSEDVDQDPLFVMKVDGAYISIATLTDEPLEKMTGIENAPCIRAIVVGKGEDFSNREGLPDGNAIMPQPETSVVLDSGDTGMLGGKYGIRAYGTVHHKGLLYTTMSEFFGVESMRIPSIYWGIIATHPGSGLCKAARKKWGFISSQDGLALAYPVIAARHDDSALVVFSYSGVGELPHSLGPAYPGVGSAIVGETSSYETIPHIVIVKLGRAAIKQTTDGTVPDGPTSDTTVARWGDYSAMQVYAGQMWYAVPIAASLDDDDDDYRRAWRSWIGVEDLDA